MFKVTMDNPIKIPPVKLGLPLHNFSRGQLLHLAACALLFLFNGRREKSGISLAFVIETQRLMILWHPSNLVLLLLLLALGQAHAMIIIWLLTIRNLLNNLGLVVLLEISESVFEVRTHLPMNPVIAFLYSLYDILLLVQFSFEL